jgi:hypothetical protein
LNTKLLTGPYEAACKLANFAATYLFDAGTKPPAIVQQHPSAWGPTGHALLALSALLLYKTGWDLQAASALYCRLKSLPALQDGLDGNLIGLNPFHDYPAWQVINSASRVAAMRTDNRSVLEQVAGVKQEMQLQYWSWISKQ